MKKILVAAILALGVSQALAENVKDVKTPTMASGVDTSKIVCKRSTIVPFYSSTLNLGAITLESRNSGRVDLITATTLNIEKAGTFTKTAISANGGAKLDFVLDSDKNVLATLLTRGSIGHAAKSGSFYAMLIITPGSAFVPAGYGVDKDLLIYDLECVIPKEK